MILVYKKHTEDELRESAAESLPLLEKWFEENPKRRVCRSELWYGKTYSLKRKDVEGQLNQIIDDLIK